MVDFKYRLLRKKFPFTASFVGFIFSQVGATLGV